MKSIYNLCPLRLNKMRNSFFYYKGKILLQIIFIFSSKFNIINNLYKIEIKKTSNPNFFKSSNFNKYRSYEQKCKNGDGQFIFLLVIFIIIIDHFKLGFEVFHMKHSEITIVNGHTILGIPDLVRSPKSSKVRPH